MLQDVYSVMINGIRNNPISRCDIELFNDMLEKSMSIKAPTLVDMNTQTIDFPPSILTHYSNV